MGFVIGGAIAGLLVAVAFILPVVSFFRVGRANRLVDETRARLDALERKVAWLTEAAERPAVHPLQTGTVDQARQAAISPAERAAAPLPVPSPPPAVPGPPHQEPVAALRTPVSPLEPAAAVADHSANEDLGFEQVIGGRWLLYAGVAAVVLGMSYFVKFAFDNGWISERLRVAAGGAAGVALVAAGVHFWSRGLSFFGQALAGGGVVVLYVSVYAALHFYHLVTPAPAFALMAMVTGAATYLADRQRSQPLAALALLGGFATPLLVGGERDVQIVLFTYIAILISGTALIARRHAWPLLSAACYVCTCQLVMLWFFSSYVSAAWLRTELFLTLYAGLFGYLLWTLFRSTDRTPQAHLARAALMTAPLGYHLASLILLNDRPAAWLIYLVLFTVVGLVVGQRTRAGWLRVVVLVLVGLPAIVWLELLRYPRWYVPAMVTMVVLYTLHLASQWEATGQDATGDVPLIEVAHAQLNGLLLPVSLFVFLESRFVSWNPWMVAALAAWNGALALVARTRAPRMMIQFIALSATLSAAALVLAFDGPVIAVGWAAEGVLVGWLASRERSRWLGIGSAVLIAMGSAQLALLLATPLPVSAAPLLNARSLAAMVVIGLLGWLAWHVRDDPAVDVRGTARNAIVVLGNVLMIALLSAEVRAYFSQRGVDASVERDDLGTAAASFAEQVTLSVLWALYAVGLIAVGIRRRYAPTRYLAIVLFAITVLKVLLQDIAGLDRLSRMLSVLGVGVLLLVASYLYQRTAAGGGARGPTP